MRNVIAGNSIRKAKQMRVFRYSLDGIFIDLFESAKVAENTLKIDRTGITRCANNKRKSAGGFIWKYHGQG